MKHREAIDPKLCYFCQREKVHPHRGWRLFLGPLTLFETANAARTCVPCGKRVHRFLAKFAEMVRRESA